MRSCRASWRVGTLHTGLRCLGSPRSGMSNGRGWASSTKTSWGYGNTRMRLPPSWPCPCLVSRRCVVPCYVPRHGCMGCLTQFRENITGCLERRRSGHLRACCRFAESHEHDCGRHHLPRPGACGIRLLASNFREGKQCHGEGYCKGVTGRSPVKREKEVDLCCLCMALGFFSSPWLLLGTSLWLPLQANMLHLLPFKTTAWGGFGRNNCSKHLPIVSRGCSLGMPIRKPGQRLAQPGLLLIKHFSLSAKPAHTRSHSLGLRSPRSIGMHCIPSLKPSLRRWNVPRLDQGG